MIWIIRDDLTAVHVVPADNGSARPCFTFEDTKFRSQATDFESWEKAEEMLRQVRKDWPLSKFAIVEFT